MSANGHPTERLSELVDYYIAPHVNKITSYIKDTNHFLETIKEITLPPNAKIVSFDVSSLYTNISHKEGVATIKRFLLEHSTPEISKMFGEFAEKVLESKIIEFNKEFYIQLLGTAMGSHMAPNYANIFMHYLESEKLKEAPLQP